MKEKNIPMWVFIIIIYLIGYNNTKESARVRDRKCLILYSTSKDKKCYI